MKTINEAFDRQLLEVELSRLIEGMSPEDAADTAILRRILSKIKARKNAALTPEEKAVLAKFNIINRDGELHVASDTDPNGYMWRSKINPPEEESPRVGSYYKQRNHPEEVNLADIARKRGKRFDRDIYMRNNFGPTVLVNPAPRGVKHDPNITYSPDSRDRSYGVTSQDQHRDAAALLMGNDVINLKYLLRNRKQAQGTLAGLDAKYDQLDAEVEDKYLKALAQNARFKDSEKKRSDAQLSTSQKGIDDLLASKRKPKSSSPITEDAYLNSSTYAVTRYCFEIKELLDYIEKLVDRNELMRADADKLLDILRNSFYELEDELAKINTIE